MVCLHTGLLLLSFVAELCGLISRFHSPVLLFYSCRTVLWLLPVPGRMLQPYFPLPQVEATLEEEQRAAWLEAVCAKRCEFWRNPGPCPSKMSVLRMSSHLGRAGVICSLPGLVALPSLVSMNLGQLPLAWGALLLGPSSPSTQGGRYGHRCLL